MDLVHVVRHKVLVEKRSLRSVERETGVSRHTIRKYLKLPEPVHVVGEPRRRRVTASVAPRIDALLDEWGKRTTPKQRITGTRLHRQLREEGVEIGITTVRVYLREKRRQAAEVFIPLVHRPGEVAQIDFFEVTVEEAGTIKKVWKFLMRLMHSGYDFVWLYERCDQLAFLDGHVRAFAAFGAVPSRCVYDNLSSAMHWRVGLTGERRRQLTDRFAALASHYLFEPCFARPGEGHDKGGVESRGRGIRLQHMVPIPRGETLSEIAEALRADLDAAAATKRDREGASVLDRFAHDVAVMRELPSAPFEARRCQTVSISSKATVQIEGAIYSVPSVWARLDATAYIGVDDIRVVCRGEVKLYTKARAGERQVRYRDYLPELARKPQAVRQVAPELLAELGQPWIRLWSLLVSTHGEREAARVFSRLLAAVVSHGEVRVREDLEIALSAEAPDLLALSRLLHAEDEVDVVAVPEALSGYEIDATSGADYDWLLEGGVR
jgi:transposase